MLDGGLNARERPLVSLLKALQGRHQGVLLQAPVVHDVPPHGELCSLPLVLRGKAVSKFNTSCGWNSHHCTPWLVQFRQTKARPHQAVILE